MEDWKTESSSGAIRLGGDQIMDERRAQKSELANGTYTPIRGVWLSGVALGQLDLTGGAKQDPPSRAAAF